MITTNHMVQAVMRAHVCPQVMYLTGWTPHASQQQPSRRGSQTVSFQVGAPPARAARASCCQASGRHIRLDALGIKGSRATCIHCWAPQALHCLGPGPCTAKAPGPALPPSCIMRALHEPTFPAGAGGRPQQPRGRRRREYQRGAVAAACPCDYIHVCTLKMSSSLRRHSCTIMNLEATPMPIQLLTLASSWPTSCQDSQMAEKAPPCPALTGPWP